MTEVISAEVLIVGAGPVGLVLAADLARRGRTVALVETRYRGEPPSVKCNHVAARSMEIFRRLGIAGKVRDAGLPGDYPHDVSYRTATTGIELTRIIIPSRDGRRRGERGPDTWWPTPEPPHRINQIFLEPILFEHVAAMPNVRILNRTECVGFEQTSDGVVMRAVALDTGREIALEGRYLVGCDGGRSSVRKAIDAKLAGDAVVQRVQSTYIRAPELLGLLQAGPAWAMFTLNPRRSGNVYSIDGRETWLVHNYLKPDEPDFDSVDRDWAIRTILGVDADFEYEVLNKEDWFGRRLVADKFRDGRVFICGDAAHIWVPYAGYGMNAGIADAANLAWMLAATIEGWAPSTVLDAHEAERLPITQQVSHFAMNHAHEMAKQRGDVPAEIEASGPRGEAARARLGKSAYELNVQQYCCGGLNFGYYYDRSPLIAYDDEAAPDYGMADFTSSTVPGCRAPHFWLASGRSLYDELGPYFTLLRLDAGTDVEPLLTAARLRKVPMKLLDIDRASADHSYRHRLVLVRPDQHVAWRGNAVPDDPAALVELIRGAATDLRRRAAA